MHWTDAGKVELQLGRAGWRLEESVHQLRQSAGACLEAV